MIETLTVDLGTRSYPIYIGAGLLADPEAYRPHIPGRQVMIVTNETVAPLYLERTKSALRDYQVDQVVLPDGERFKTLDTWNSIFDALLQARFGRDCTLVALGGGVVGDMAGFAAACYQRGVSFIQVPTTLLAQVDSSVGGKTGINHPAGKNMIGAFHQPLAVIADIETLDTLPQRELSAGLAEVLKYGLIRDTDFLAWLEEQIDRLLARDPSALGRAILRSCEIKADIVGADELESGDRALLNLGHTFGHAIEAGTGYGNWLHGEAVGAGTCMAASLSGRLGWLAETDVERVRKIIGRAGLPTAPPADLSADRFIELMAIDKKVLSGKLRLVLLESIGNAVVFSDPDQCALRATLSEHRGGE